MSAERADAVTAASANDLAPGHPFIRPYRPGDRDAVFEICLRTAAGGGDATGVYSDDSLMPEVFALPYVTYDPDLAFVVDDGRDGRALGYIIGVADTRTFVEWWKREWTPGFRERHPSPGASTGREPGFTEAQLIDAGTNPDRMLIAEVDAYPAHLHIDLLPELQGQGLGRRLIDTLREALAARGVPAVHLGMDAANTAARAFYDRLGFHELPSSRPDAPLLGIATDRGTTDRPATDPRATDRRSDADEVSA
ncbi:ribosomal protein S18 acetylase RimI-like enzyme [Agromyces sp. 3263]|uniref:GNAT family N-acetyltransferase n=1 Tax=Agromyces sp. 3263 TaxID=2817750 RepID=UPI00285CEE92|nr:GNAT family N-acetyltransferase [Agromyces sp. 3263]MDR6904855.1 ribosomal protein S18 acetylase RimI-like enzyme [Agromyces sp. 3263]